MSIDAYRWLMTAPKAPLERASFPAQAGTGEVVVTVAGCGVCHTDLGYYYDGVRTNQPPPLALGLRGSAFRLMRDVGAPTTVTEVGYTEDDIPAIVEGALKQQRLLVNAPKPVDAAALEAILRDSL